MATYLVFMKHTLNPR